MKTRMTRWMTVLALAFGIGVATSLAQEKSEQPLDQLKDKAKAELEKKLGGEKSGGPSDEEMRKQMEAMAALAPQHEHFKKLVGKWDVVSTWTMPGGAPPGKATGTAEYKLIMGGRYLVEDVNTIDADEQPFTGHGISGFDKSKGKYVGVWMDSMGTGIAMSEGTADASGKILTSTMEVEDPMTKQKKKIKMVEEIMGDDKMVMKMYEPREGKEEMTLEVTYTRKK